MSLNLVIYFTHVPFDALAQTLGPVYQILLLQIRIINYAAVRKITNAVLVDGLI